MTCATCDLHIERLVCRSPGDNDSRLVGVIKDHTVCDMPCSAVKVRCATQASFLLYGEHNHQGWVWQLLFNSTPHNLQDDCNSGSIISSEISGAIAIEDAIAHNGLVPKSRWDTIHMRIEQDGYTFPSQC